MPMESIDSLALGGDLGYALDLSLARKMNGHTAIEL